MTDWTPRDCTIDLSFLGEGSYEAEIFSDGINADREATDYKKEVRTVTSGDKLNIHMHPEEDGQHGYGKDDRGIK
mgnify:FL=1